MFWDRRIRVVLVCELSRSRRMKWVDSEQSFLRLDVDVSLLLFRYCALGIDLLMRRDETRRDETRDQDGF